MAKLIKFYQTKKFKAIQKTWEKRLIDSGFKDAEILISGSLCLRQRASNAYRGADPFTRRSKQRYFSFLGRMYHGTKFKNAEHAIVMERRSHGCTIQEIAKELGCYREKVREIIKRYERKWRIKK